YRRARAHLAMLRASAAALVDEGERTARIARATAVVERTGDDTLRTELAAILPTLRPPVGGYALGQHVDVLWKGDWYLATVLAIPSPDHYLVHYDHYPAYWDETVGLDRMR